MSPALPDSLPSRPYFGRVDALRGLAALVVGGYHFSGCVVHGITLLPQVPWVGAELIQNAIGRVGVCLVPGHLAVMVFFVISGFVLRLSLGHGPQTVTAATAKLVITRLFRFFPIVWVGVIVAAFMRPSGIGSEALGTRMLVSNLLLFDVSMNPQLWSLQVELLMAPVILALYFLELRWGPAALLAVTAATTGLAFVPHWAVWPVLSTSLFAFGLGMLIPTYGRRIAHWLTRRGATLVVIVSIAVLIALSPCLGAYSRFTEIIGAYAATALIGLLAYRVDVPVLKWSDARWLHRIGAASGSYYVLHMATVPAVTAFAAAAVPSAWSAEMPGLVGLGVIVVWLAAIALPAIIVARFVEMPGVAVGRRVVALLGLHSQRSTPIEAARPADVTGRAMRESQDQIGLFSSSRASPSAAVSGSFRRADHRLRRAA